jgi:hypothetical protein
LTRYRSIDAGLRSLSADLLCCGSPARIRAGAWDFFTVETVVVRRYYVVFFMEHASRRVLLAGCSSNPDGCSVAQHARNVGSVSPSG